MKQQKILVTVISSLTVIVCAAFIWNRYIQLGPIADITNPVSAPISDTQIAANNKSTDLNSNNNVKPSVQIPRSPAPTVTTPQPTANAPKQNAVRETVIKEHVYYPLLTANDPGYSTDWAIQKVNAPAAWDISTGNGQTVVAVIDTGFSLNHEDLINSWYNNSGEIGTTKVGDRCWTGTAKDKSTNNCDDDNNGYVDDWRGWNFSIGDNNPAAGRTNPNGAGVSHGTETAGLAGAAGNNSTGIATINWNTKIIPLQALSDDGPGYTSDVAAAIYYAVDNGADIINMSFGGSDYDPAITTATDYAFANNVVVVAAAGNCGTGNEVGCEGLAAGFIGYPALNDHVIAVGATTSSDQRASFSSYGPSLDVVAPGSGTINSPTWTPNNATTLYTSSLYGTSSAAPQVASLASLIKSIRPSSSVDDITALILATTTKISAMNGALYTNELGHGLINVSTALTVASSLNSTSATPELLQAGGAVSEHRYAASDTLGSGCVTTANSYCTVWMRNNNTGIDRYLPYAQANSQGQTGWSWSGAILPTGDWQVRATQGDYLSNIYFLGGK